MRRACWLAVVCAGMALSGDEGLDIAKLVSRVGNALVVDRNDKRIADSLTKVELSERLTPETGALLIRMGVGRRTARALRELEKRSAKLPAPSQKVLAFTPVPSVIEQREILARVEHYASAYLARFPNFIANETIRQYVNYVVFDGGRARAQPFRSVADRWYLMAELTSEVAYASGSDQSKSSDVAQRRDRAEERVSRGEFGGMLEEIFHPSRGATFAWDRWQVINGVRTAVFSYVVPPQSSQYSVCCRIVQIGPAQQPARRSVSMGHRGFVFADPESGRIVRLALIGATEALDVISGMVQDYHEVTIGENRQVVPVASIAYVSIDGLESREEIEYTNHRKFEAESAITFGGEPGDSEGLVKFQRENGGRGPAESKPETGAVGKKP